MMDGLRLALIIIAVLLFAGIYLWEIRKQPDYRKRAVVRQSDSLDVEHPAAGEAEQPQGPSEPPANRDSHMPDSANERAGRVETNEPPPVNPITTVVPGTETATERPGYAHSEASVARKASTDRQQPHSIDSEQELITLFITAAENTAFNGASIRRAAEAVGMVYGAMQIFHHFGADHVQSGQPLFSMANMFEPGTFDFDTLSEFETRGIAVFIYTSALAGGRQAFDLFINSARAIAAALGGDIRMADRALLRDSDIETLRERIQ